MPADDQKTQMSPHPRGRPRSRSVDQTLLRATLHLLAEEGCRALTMEAIAAKAGVSKATLYRRWKSPDEVVTAAVAGLVEDIRIPDTGSLEEDLLVLMTQAVAVYHGVAGRILPGLLAAMATHEGVAHAVRTRFLEGRRAALATVLERAAARGELPPDVDVPLALDFLGGPLFYRLLVTDGAVDDAFAKGVVTTLLHGLAATPQGDKGTDT